MRLAAAWQVDYPRTVQRLSSRGADTLLPAHVADIMSMRLTRLLIAFLFLVTASTGMAATFVPADCPAAGHQAAGPHATGQHDVAASDGEHHADRAGNIQSSAACHAGVTVCCGSFPAAMELREPVTRTAIRFRFRPDDGHSIDPAKDLPPPRHLAWDASGHPQRLQEAVPWPHKEEI